MNALGENKTFYLCIIKLVLSQSASAAKIKLPNAHHLHRNGHTFNREMHLYGLHNQRCVCLFKSVMADLFLMSVSGFIVVTCLNV